MESDGILSILLSFLFLGPRVLVLIIIYSFNLDPMLVHKIKLTNSTVKNKTKQKIGYSINNNISLCRFEN